MSIFVFTKLIYFSIFLLQCRSASLPRIFAFHFQNVTFVTSSEKCFEFILCTFSNIGLFQEKTNRGGGWGHGISRGIEEVEGGISKNDVNFSGVIRKQIGISSSLGFWFWNFQGVQLIQLYVTGKFQESSLVLSGIAKGKVTYLEILAVFPKKEVCPQFFFFFFFGIVHCRAGGIIKLLKQQTTQNNPQS